MGRIRVPRRSATGAGSEGGSVTAELAVLLPGVVLAIVVILVAASAGVAQVRCADAARAGARAAALGKTPQEVSAIAEELAGDGAQVSVTDSDQWVRVRVSVPVPLGPLSGVLGAEASFSALPEPAAGARVGEGRTTRGPTMRWPMGRAPALRGPAPSATAGVSQVGPP